MSHATVKKADGTSAIASNTVLDAGGSPHVVSDDALDTGAGTHTVFGATVSLAAVSIVDFVVLSDRDCVVT